MRILITGICGFVGSTLARALLEEGAAGERVEVVGIDNLMRPGSELNRPELLRRGARVIHGDLRAAEDVSDLPRCDFVIDAAANPSVLAGVDGRSSPKSVFDHNLTSTIHLLEYCRSHSAGFTLLSTSRVYAIEALSRLPMRVIRDEFFNLNAESGPLPAGVSLRGIAETFSTAAPVSLYGASKLASEQIALEYGATFGFPVWINRCGVLAGAGQFGRADQGIFAYWINGYLRRRPLKYIGFGGAGYQFRDVLHPRWLLPVLRRQFAHTGSVEARICNIGGGPPCGSSLRGLSAYCEERFGFGHEVASDPRDRQFDIPWVSMDSALAMRLWNFQPPGPGAVLAICDEIASHAEANENWLEISAAR